MFIIGDDIKAHRKRMRYTHEELAHALGISRQTLMNWEKGASVPSLEDAAKLAKVFDITLDDLVGKKTSAKLGPDEREFWGTVTVKKGGMVIIPQKILDHMDIRWGDELLVVTDVERGLEFLPKDILWEKNLEKNFRGEKIVQY